MPLKIRKYILISIIFISYLLIFINYIPLNTSTPWVGFVGKLLGLAGVLILTWQFLLGVRGLVSRLIPDLIWVNKLHKLLGTYGVTLIFFHPVFITLYYMGLGINTLTISINNPFDYYKFFGQVAITILGIVWILSAFLRKRISFRWWKKIHLFVYIVLPLVLYHSSNIGTDLRSPFLSAYWEFIVILYICILIYRIPFALGFLKHKYEVVEVKEVTPDVHTITMKPLGKAIIPKPGQFIYVQPGRFAENHPFTASHFDEKTKYISVTPKASGPFSNKIQNIKVGTKVFIDGPYGVFTQEAYTTRESVVLIIGGIGITPFVRLIKKIKNGWDKQVVLFYANKDQKEIAFKDEIEDVQRNHSNFKVINVLSQATLDKSSKPFSEPPTSGSSSSGFSGEKGRINIDLIKKYLIISPEDNLMKYDFFVCGPPPMIKSIVDQLTNAGVKKEKIHSELFSL